MNTNEYARALHRLLESHHAALLTEAQHRRLWWRRQVNVLAALNLLCGQLALYRVASDELTAARALCEAWAAGDERAA